MAQKTVQDFYKHEADISKADAIKICSDHLKGNWQSLKEDDFSISVIQGGFVNRIFLCENKPTGENVLLRLYGGKLLDKDSMLRGGSIETEVLIFHIMSEKGIGPKLHGVFSGGRLEQFIENSTTLSNDHCQTPEVMAAFAKKLAQMHATEVPISKTPKDFFGIAEPLLRDKLDQYLEFTKTRDLPPVPELQAAAQAAYHYDFMAYAAWLKDLLPKIKTRIVLSHNDMNRLNCLVRDEVTDPSEKVVLLDYEFSCYGYRGMDIGNHFKNRTLDIKELMSGKLDSIKPYPSEEERRFFVAAYLEESAKHVAVEQALDNEETLLLEAEYFAAVYQLFFTAFIVRDFEKWRDIQVPIHPAVMLAGTVKDLEERRANIIDLMQRL